MGKSKRHRGVRGRSNTSRTPYDDAFRTMWIKGGQMCIPFLNEMFRQADPLSYDVAVENVANERYSVEDRGEQRKRVTDSVVHINDHTYHTECESGSDGTILARMAEYDSGIALDEHEYRENKYRMRMPSSGVLFLRKAPEKSDVMTIVIEAGEKSLEYTVESICLSDYSMEELFEKDLLFLVPFYMFNLEGEFKKCEKALSRNVDSRQGGRDETSCELRSGQESACDHVTGSIIRLFERINGLHESGELSSWHYSLIINMLRKVTDALARKYKYLRKELDLIMGGKVLKIDGEEYYYEGKAEGRDKQARLTAANLAKMGMNIQQIAEAVEYNAGKVAEWLDQPAG